MKHCGRCGQLRPHDEYGVRDRKTGRVHTICKTCRADYCRAYYYKDVAGYNERRRTRARGYRARNRGFVEAYLLAHPCADCGLVDPIVMEFDHVRGTKLFHVSTLVRDCAALAVLKAEIAKCVVRCANCHRRRTAKELWRRTFSVEQGLKGTASD
jgi:hypothetical protein